MIRARDPVRLTDPGADAAPDLAEAIRASRINAVSADRVAALHASLAPQLATPTLSGTGLAWWAWWAWWKWMLGLTLPLATGLYLSGSWPCNPESAAPTSSPERLEPADVTRKPAPARPEPTSAPAEPDPEVTAVSAAPMPHAPAAKPRPHGTTRVAKSPSSQAAAKTRAAQRPKPRRPAELSLLRKSRATLDNDAKRALRLAERHRKLYPRGMFAQEREVLAIEALLKLERKPAALQRAKRFLQRYPTSTHARHIRMRVEHGSAAR